MAGEKAASTGGLLARLRWSLAIAFGAVEELTVVNEIDLKTTNGSCHLLILF
jgi:hypothetical protein